MCVCVANPDESWAELGLESAGAFPNAIYRHLGNVPIIVGKE